MGEGTIKRERVNEAEKIQAHRNESQPVREIPDCRNESLSTRNPNQQSESNNSREPVVPERIIFHEGTKVPE